jgi:multidrug resistance efflux pump
MIAFISLCYASIYILIFNKFKLLPKTTPNVSAFIGVGVVLIASIIFAWYTFAPMSSDARVTRYIIPIVPNVKGQLIDVSVTHMQRVNKGDLLYQIDPAPYQHKVDELIARIEAQSAERDLNRANLERARELVAKKAASQYEQDIWEAKYAASSAAIAATEATLENARWQLNETTVLAPANGFPVNVQLRPGSYVTTMPAASALAFVSTESSDIITSFSQSAIRRIKSGDAVEVVFTRIPGEVFSGKVVHIGEATAESQLQASANLRSLNGTPARGRWPVVVKLDDETLAAELPQGAGGSLAIYTDAGALFHIISKIVLRMNAWTGYLTAP